MFAYGCRLELRPIRRILNTEEIPKHQERVTCAQQGILISNYAKRCLVWCFSEMSSGVDITLTLEVRCLSPEICLALSTPGQRLWTAVAYQERTLIVQREGPSPTLTLSNLEHPFARSLFAWV